VLLQLPHLLLLAQLCYFLVVCGREAVLQLAGLIMDQDALVGRDHQSIPNPEGAHLILFAL